ncbi:MAG: endo-1,4-beta-xylanase [Spirochaetales bacterium]|nr:endo-1,4-beta-xylanase [Spirochaetales bacterium]
MNLYTRLSVFLLCLVMSSVVSSCVSKPVQETHTAVPTSTPVPQKTTTGDVSTKAPETPALDITLEPKGDKYLGNIWSTSVSEDPLFLQLWNQVTPENAGKWGSVEVIQDTMRWQLLDNAYNFAKANNFPFRLHTLVWGNQQPEWISSLSPTEQLEEIEEWMALLSDRYPDIDFIDVVNEPLHAPPSYRNALGGSGKTGWDWVISSFELAREYFPGASLHLNDYSITSSEDATTTYINVIELLKKRNLIDGIGLQGHFLERIPVATISRNMNRLAETGLPVHITELDIDLGNDSIQAKRLKDIFTFFWEHEAVKGITIWGYREKMVWRKSAYLVRDDGSARESLKWLSAYLKGEDYEIPPPAKGMRYGSPDGIRIEAESFNDAKGLEADNGVITGCGAGDWVLYEKVFLMAGYSRLRISYTGVSEVPGKILVRLDKLEADNAAAIETKFSGGPQSFIEGETAWKGVEGMFDVYLVFEGAEDIGNIDYLEFSFSE